MISNHIKIAWRNLRKAKGLNAIHIIGIAVAIAAATLLYLTAMFELSFDTFHENRDRIGLAYTTTEPESGLRHSATMPAPFAPALKAEFPDVELISRFANSSVILRHGDKQLESTNKYVDADFLSIFSFPILEGNAKALENLDGIVLDDITARNLYGSTNIVGQQVEIYQDGNWMTKQVTAVIQATPRNSSLSFSSLMRFEQMPNYSVKKEDWSNENHSVFVKLKNKVDDTKFTVQAKAFMDQYYKENNDMLKRDGAKADKNGAYISLHLLPFSDYQRNDLDLGRGASPMFPWILLLIAALILFIACSNFINLSLANAITRNKEIGTRKTLGGTTGQLIGQLWVESLLLCLIGLVIGLTLAWLILPEYNAAMNYKLQLKQLFLPLNLLYFSLAFALLTLLAGGYPAWRIAKTNIIQVLKGTVAIKGSALRNSLTVLQFAIAIVLIISTIVISAQLHFIAERPLGFTKTEVISIPIGEGINPQTALQQMRVELGAQPWVRHVSASDINIGRGNDGNMSTSRFGFDYEGRQVSTNFMRIEYDYLQTLGIKLLSGRDFNRSFSTDTAAVLINQQMAAQLGGAEKVVGKTLAMDGNPQIIGVIDDFNFQNLRRTVEPLTLSINPNIFEIAYIFVRVQTDNLQESLEQVNSIWKKVNPKANIAPSYLDENTQKMYKDEQRFAQIIIGGAIVAIVIACLGLFALALLTINRRIKEIGIRKVLGSSITQIVVLLSRDFVKLMVIAFIIASPIAWWMMNSWLRGFAYRIDISIWMFLGAGVLVLLIALATITWQTVRAATGNPVDSLRDE
ncbi:ABC transporter permease [Sphingobacterium psychroaquaticum]|uniref:FtsX-like permease family protein n=1 Tax=Sphingobacterium psychroaquaticum TaxID=561061 RepID=A0A1X7J4R2_9SPHI|nr:ABC transporter permease [Sphingobacterium psychroaquaticum]SMG22281.1 FtsX-like permease family protein [Sphingobacterium psychroaquaticum]